MLSDEHELEELSDPELFVSALLVGKKYVSGVV